MCMCMYDNLCTNNNVYNVVPSAVYILFVSPMLYDVRIHYYSFVHAAMRRNVHAYATSKDM